MNKKEIGYYFTAHVLTLLRMGLGLGASLSIVVNHDINTAFALSIAAIPTNSMEQSREKAGSKVSGERFAMVLPTSSGYQPSQQRYVSLSSVR